MVLSLVFYPQLYFCFYSITIPPHFHTPKSFKHLSSQSEPWLPNYSEGSYDSDMAYPFINQIALPYSFAFSIATFAASSSELNVPNCTFLPST